MRSYFILPLFFFSFILLTAPLTHASVEVTLLKCTSRALGAEDAYLVTVVPSETGMLGDQYFVKEIPFFPNGKKTTIALSNASYINYCGVIIFMANNGRSGYVLIYQRGEDALIDMNLGTPGANDVPSTRIETGKMNNTYTCSLLPKK